MIVVTHNPAIARRANRIMEMRKGEATEKLSAAVGTEPLNAALPLPFEPLVIDREGIGLARIGRTAAIDMAKELRQTARFIDDPW